MKRILSIAGLSIALSLSINMASLAAQTDRWHVSGDGTWYLFNEQRTGDVVNSWFQDLDGSWYLLAPGDGHMYAGLIHDTLTDRWYYCQTEHDGWYGRMAHANGPYTVNGHSVSLTFNQEHDGTFGAITSGLDDIKGTGIPTQDIEGIPEDVATSSSSSNSNSSASTNTNTNTSTNSSNGTISDVHQAWLDAGFDEEEYQYWVDMGCTDENIEAMLADLEEVAKEGGAGGHVDWH